MTSLGWALLGVGLGIAAGFALARAFGWRRRRLSAPPPVAPAQATRANDGAFVRLVGALATGVVVIDARSYVEFANAAAGTIFGFDAARAPNMHVIAAIPNVELERRIAEALAGESSVAPLILTGARGRRTYRVSVAALPGEPDQPPRAVVFADDQTANARLDRARREFLSNVSHELRTPLSSIKLMLETVLASPDDEARDLFLPQALAQVDRLTALVAQLLEQARAESGQMKLAIRDVDLEAIARPIVESFEPQAAQKGVVLTLVPANPIRVEVDPDRLAQVFVNMIDNALRHTPEGGRVKIELSTRGNDAVIRVRDSGVGIPYRDLPRIFERFYVVDRSRTRMSGGAGLGLAIVKGIVDAHRGSIVAESTLGKGSTFTIHLPLAGNG